MKTFCIFCGLSPEAKTKEHVIPRWLIRATGKPNRIASFGVDLSKSPLRMRRFAFDALTFPACHKCNATFGSLEATAKPVLESVLAEEPISARKFHVLLDWLDKIRIGLWLGYFYLDKNPAGITPSYHIQTRVRQTDRACVIFHIKDREQGLNFIGPESPCFQPSPTCLAILINKWCFLNISGISINSRRLGFPYAQPVELREDGRMVVSIEPGTHRIMRPVQRDLLFANSTTLQQPIFLPSLMSPNVHARFREEWVRSRSLEPDDGVGSVFIETCDRVFVYPSDASREWIPDVSWSVSEIYARIPPFVFARLSDDLENAANLSTKEQRRQILRSLTLYRSVNKAIVDRMKRAMA
jgi:hypothetical protein